MFMRADCQFWRMYGEFVYDDVAKLEIRCKVRILLDDGEVPHQFALETDVLLEEGARSLALIQCSREKANRHHQIVAGGLRGVNGAFKPLFLNNYYSYKIVATAGGERKEFLSWLLLKTVRASRN